MTRKLLLVGLVFATGPRMLQAQTQAEMNDAASAQFRRADSTLNAVYSELVARYRSDALALRKLRSAQRAWLAFRDAHVEATYPALDQQRYGSVLPMCIAGLLEQLTNARIEQLREALNPPEGDVCVGGPI